MCVGYDNKLSLNKEQFCEALSILLNKGSRDEVSLLILYLRERERGERERERKRERESVCWV